MTKLLDALAPYPYEFLAATVAVAVVFGLVLGAVTMVAILLLGAIIGTIECVYLFRLSR